MKRPLEDDTYANPALAEILTTAVAPTWYERLGLKLYMAARRAFDAPLSCTHYNTRNPCLIFDNVAEIMDRLDLAKITPHLHTDRKLRYPVEAPVIDPSRHFAQWAVVWEPVRRHPGLAPMKDGKTLKVEVGAGMYLLSLTFTPLRDNPFGDAMQLDSLTLHQGHDVFHLTPEISESVDETRINTTRVAQLFGAARATIELITDDYPCAEMALADGCRGVVEEMRAEEQAQDRAQRAADAAEASQARGRHGLSPRQEPR